MYNIYNRYLYKNVPDMIINNNIIIVIQIYYVLSFEVASGTDNLSFQIWSPISSLKTLSNHWLCRRTSLRWPEY